VREFSSYPTALDDVPRLLERYFDVVIVDLDSDQEFALGLVASICAESTATVMVYSEKADRELMERAMRIGAREYLVLPFDQSVMDKALNRARIGLHSRTRLRDKAPGDLQVFFGAKGGTGVTTIACNLAIALAQEPDHSTLLIDLAIPLGDAALNLGIAAEYSTDHALRDPEHLDARHLLALVTRHRSGVFVLAAPSRVPEVEASKPAVDRLVNVARQQFDHVIVDVGSRIDLTATDLFQRASTIYLVTQAGISELRNSNRLISQFFSDGGPNLEIVLNRFAPHLHAGVNEEVITKALGRPVRWKIPDDQDAARQMQSTTPAVSSADSPISRLILQMASSIAGHPVPQEPIFAEEVPATERLAAPGFEASLPAVQALNQIAPIPVSSPAASAPAITWPAPDPITHGTPLSAVQLNATVSAPGTLIYTPGPGYILPAGTHTLWVTFNPEHATGDAPLQAAVSIAVTKAAPVITWPSPADLPWGHTLDASQLNATASVPGEFAYEPAAGEVLEVGTHSLSVAFTPTDVANYEAAQASALIAVFKQTPVLEWRQIEPIVYGQALSGPELCATASVAGEIAYHPAAGEILSAGSHTLTATFHPADDAHYSSVQATATISVAKATPVLAWPEPAPLQYGELLGDAQLNASTPVHGAFAYNLSAGALLAAGEHRLSAIFTPSDGENYETAQAALGLTVLPSTPAVSWPSPEPILQGEALSGAQLNAASPVLGTFSYSPSIGEVLTPGRHALEVTFTPADNVNYSAVHATVTIDVVESSPTTIEWSSPSPVSYGTPLGDTQLNATASAPGKFIYTPAAGHVLPPGKYTLSAAFIPADRWHHTPAQATVELVVEAPAGQSLPHAEAEETPVSADGAQCDAAPEASLELESTMSDPPQYPHRETRSYRGAIYEKGEDGQWHLQQK